MKKIKILSFLTFIVFYGCNTKVASTTTTQVDSINDSLSVKQLDTVQSTSDKKNEIIDNTFFNMPLGESNFYNKGLSQYFKGAYVMSKQTVKNRYTDGLDTLIYLTIGKSSIKFHKTPEKILLDSVVVLDRNFIVLKKNLDIGMSKRAFLKSFNIDKIPLFMQIQ